MNTKTRNLIIGIMLFVLTCVAGLTFMHFAMRQQIEDVFEGSDITQSADEALLGMGKEKAPDAKNALWLYEKSDVSFDNKEKLSATADKIDKEVFTYVFLSFEKLLDPEGKITGSEEEKLRAASAVLKEKGFKVYLSVPVSCHISAVSEIMKYTDGMLIDAEGLTVDKLNNELLKIKAICTTDIKYKVFAKISIDTDTVKFNKKSVDGLYFDISPETDTEKLTYWDKVLDVTKTKMICSFDLQGIMNKKESPDAAVKSVYSIRGLKSVFIRSFSSYKAVTKNYQGSFSAVCEYITDGIVPELAFRQVGISGYNGETVFSGDFTKEIEVYGSNLFPVYIDGEKLSLGETGSKKITLSLDEEKKSYSIKQCSEEREYKVEYLFTGELIDSVSPSVSVFASPGEKLRVIAVAYSKAEVTVKMGAKRYTAKPATKDKACYTAFIANIKMPSSAEEIESLGQMKIIATYNGTTVQADGAVIIPAGSEAQGITQQSTTHAFIGNYVPDLPEDAFELTTAAPTLPQTQITTSPNITQPTYNSYTGNQMCVVTEPYADTWPLIDGDDTYVPHYTPLPYGTVDYITGESEAYNEDDGEQVYFYELASGRKVKRSAVGLIAKQNYGSNAMNVVSCTGSGGTMTIKLSTNWRVPYDFYYSPQNYYSAYGKVYNVTSFTASSIQFVFYHTSAVQGSIDASLSDVVSSAVFTQSQGTVTLTMPLRATGRYYGCSVEYDQNGYLTITVHNKPQTLSGSVILLDPGHGGNDPGALGLSGGVHESNVNYALSYYTKLALEKRGATVYLTRGGDTSVSLEERKAMARSLKPDFFLSIHCNGSTDKSKIGTAVYYYKPFSFSLAQNVYTNLLSVFRNNLYAGQSSLYSSLADGTAYYPFSVTRLEDCPSVLIETGFVTNDNECMKLIDSNNQQLLAEAIAKGVESAVNA
ncbi:MAG: N-acetylmuramoyl-L-alanine amidase [Clostridia bacterium]|nr:N-acetylmuramoyl-L-alanine amidase [Clostridia bacterium]